MQWKELDLETVVSVRLLFDPVVVFVSEAENSHCFV